MALDAPVVEPAALRGEIVAARALGVAVAACVLFAAVHATIAGTIGVSHPRNWLVAIGCTLLGLRVVAHVQRNSVGWMLLAMGAFGAVAVAVAGWRDVPAAAWVDAWVWWPTYALLPAVALVFPTGSPVSRRWRPVLVASLVSILLGTVGLGWASWSSPGTFWDDAVSGEPVHGFPKHITMIGLAGVVLSLLAAVVALALRWRRSAGDQRRLFVWATSLLAIAVLAFLLEIPFGDWSWFAGAIAFPAAAVIAIVRYGLYDISLIIHRSLLYGTLTVALLALYTLVALAAGSVFSGQAAVFGTAAAVLAINPLRHTVQRRLDRWLYGTRADPYAALSTLGGRLEHSLAPNEVLPAVAATIAESLKLPYVAIRGGGALALAEHGSSHGWPQLRFPMTYRGKTIGDLVVEPRAPDERLTDRELSLLADLARSTAPAAQSLRLTADLQLARERLVRAREEERLRLRRDLHDGVGPSLVGIRLQLRAARRALSPSDAEVLDAVLTDVDTTAAEVRALVDGLRPPILDQGLVLALRQEAARFTGPGLSVVVDADELTGLPAAVEVAAYRIAAEALTNTARHSGAASCRITVRRNSNLELEIVDDGSGVAADATPGVGLGSMRERCAELGGSCTVGAASPRGTRVVALIPLEAQ
ncbi:sensor histidine kinase [Lentzea tibetensis]|uniref:sensor histidine kinase n=1 Tax=Lentzea tibetensis TaxID=2591470 RepID=UPI001647BFE1|nr:histidine kinase [Lentzea tibetensis]